MPKSVYVGYFRVPVAPQFMPRTMPRRLSVAEPFVRLPTTVLWLNDLGSSTGVVLPEVDTLGECAKTWTRPPSISSNSGARRRYGGWRHRLRRTDHRRAANLASLGEQTPRPGGTVSCFDEDGDDGPLPVWSSDRSRGPRRHHLPYLRRRPCRIPSRSRTVGAKTCRRRCNPPCRVNVGTFRPQRV
jgi:hypothetical protein